MGLQEAAERRLCDQMSTAGDEAEQRAEGRYREDVLPTDCPPDVLQPLDPLGRRVGRELDGVDRAYRGSDHRPRPQPDFPPLRIRRLLAPIPSRSAIRQAVR